MIYREMQVDDILEVLEVRHSVKENQLSDPNSVGEADCVFFLEQVGKGWVALKNDQVVGFSMLDLKNRKVWALFVRPEFEAQGIGKKLHDIMIDWHFKNNDGALVLGTDPDTRAAVFYSKQGWKKIGYYDNGELKFQLEAENWNK